MEDDRTDWHRQMWQLRDSDHDASEDVDPDELGTFGEYLDHYTARGGMTEDERTAFWVRWTKETIVWLFVAVAALIVKGMYGGVVDMLASAIGAFAILGGLGWQAVEAVLFNHKARRWQR